jgi:hypothetical protein
MIHGTLHLHIQEREIHTEVREVTRAGDQDSGLGQQRAQRVVTWLETEVRVRDNNLRLVHLVGACRLDQHHTRALPRDMKVLASDPPLGDKH